MTTGLNGDIYACVYGGRIYKQTGGTGDFVVIDEQVDNRNWCGMTTGLNGDVYASVQGGRIYKQTGGTGDFLVIAGQYESINWMDMTTGLNGDIYACGEDEFIYKQTNGTGDFLVIDTELKYWYGMTTGLNGDIYACVLSGRIYKTSLLNIYQLLNKKQNALIPENNITAYAKEFVNVNSGTITRDEDGEIETVAITDGRTLTISRNEDGTINTVSDGVRLWTFTYTDGLLTSWSVEEI